MASLARTYFQAETSADCSDDLVIEYTRHIEGLKPTFAYIPCDDDALCQMENLINALVTEYR